MEARLLGCAVRRRWTCRSGPRSLQPDGRNRLLC